MKPKRMDVVLVDLGNAPTKPIGVNQVIGHEQANIRPCVIIQTLDSADLAVIIPFTTSTSASKFYHTVGINAPSGGLKKDSYALCHQIRTISSDRITGSIGTLPIQDFNKILTVLDDFLDL